MVGESHDRERVLIVDDSRTQRKLLCLQLEAAGYAVTAAATSQEALALLGCEQFDVMMTDLSLPHVDGAELIRRARAEPRHEAMLTLLVSGSAIDRLAEACAEAGADGYLRKPFLRQTLAAALVSGRQRAAGQR